MKTVLVAGGSGFIGTNLIKRLLNEGHEIVSIDNYSTGKKKNHISNPKVKYINENTKNISKVLKTKKKNIKVIFHFGEFARIYQSFNKMNQCISSNTIGSHEVFNFCFINKIKLIYSATSSSIGNRGEDKNLSPYAFTKSKNLEILENFKKWFNFKFEIVYFYNVYGKNQIMRGEMATVIGIFEDQFNKKQPLTIVKPGTQTRRFTHVSDTVNACFYAFKKNKCRHYSISHKQNLSIIQVAKMFNTKIKYLPKRRGERYASALTNMNLSNKVYKMFGKINLEDYIKNIVKLR